MNIHKHTSVNPENFVPSSVISTMLHLAALSVKQCNDDLWHHLQSFLS